MKLKYQKSREYPTLDFLVIENACHGIIMFLLTKTIQMDRIINASLDTHIERYR